MRPLTLTEQFDRGMRVIHKGREVAQVMRVPVMHPCKGHIEFISKRRRRPTPGISMDAKNAVFVFNENEKMPGVSVFFDRRPAYVPFKVLSPKNAAMLHVWNIWEGDYGSQDAWLVNSGMIVEEQEPGPDGQRRWLVRCSSGPNDEPNFDDLVFRMELAPLKPSADP